MNTRDVFLFPVTSSTDVLVKVREQRKAVVAERWHEETGTMENEYVAVIERCFEEPA